MRNRISSELVDRAFELAYFIIPDKATALRIATDAFASLELVAKAQRRRRYYRPSLRGFGRGRRLRLRNRVSFRRHHLLQRLIYRASEPYERRDEANGHGPDADELTVRFVKHLTRITLRRNAFYVAIGLARLLHRYNTDETTALYSLVVQDPDRSRHEDYYRAAKQRLLADLCDRFGTRLRTRRGPYGELRPDFDEDPGPRAALVLACLERFVPWDTQCLVPERLDPFADELDALRSDGSDPDAEHPIEIHRIHALLHPACFARLTRALRLAPPGERLAVPRFQMTTRDDNDGLAPPASSDRFRPPPLGAAERREVAVALAERSARRRRIRPDRLVVAIDGVEVARLGGRKASRVHFDVARDAEVIEVRGYDADGEVPLAVLVLDDLEARRRTLRARTGLEGGQAVFFVLRPMADHLEAEVAYRETSLIRAVASAVESRVRRVAAALGSGRRRALWALATAALMAGALFVVGPEALRDPRWLDAPSIDVPDEALRTRDRARDNTVDSLAAVKHVHVDPLGDGPYGRRLHSLLAARLTVTGRLATRRDQADAVLKAAEPLVDGSARISAVLVERGGTVLWRGSYAGTAEQVADRLLLDLEGELDRARTE